MTNLPEPAGRYRHLDGLRGLLTLIVMGMHGYWVVVARGDPRAFVDAILYGTPRYPVEAGWVAVDIFFVMSGFLISLGLLKNRGARGAAARFYLARILRIVPLYALLLVVVLWLQPVFFGGLVPDGAHRHAARYLCFIQNFFTGTFLETYALLPTWSLAVEVHFYLLWPILLLRLSARTLVPLMVILALAAPLARWAAMTWFPAPGIIYGPTVFRTDGFALGTVLALAVHGVPAARWLLNRRVRGVLLALLPTSLAVLLLTNPIGPPIEVDHPIHNALIFFTIALGGTGLIAWAIGGSGGGAAALLGLRPLVYLGKISYGLYLLHMIVFMNLARAWPFGDLSLVPVMFIAVIALASICWYLLEAPAMRLGKMFRFDG